MGLMVPVRVKGLRSGAARKRLAAVWKTTSFLIKAVFCQGR